MELLLGLIVGVGLAAACGFRVFVPALGMSIAALTGHVQLTPAFAWLGTWPALIAFGTAAVLEVGAFYIPLLDNLLDTVTAPMAVIAGTVLTASSLGDTSPFLKWTLAAIAGGGVSGIVHVATAGLRGASSMATAGLGNFAVSSGELVLAVLLTVLAMLLPVAALLLVIFVVYKLMKRLLGVRRACTLA
ncbi:MAG TPA: DUF4126 domain-containing protein [Burkholderiaceae bacterium]